jgi:hypothetical protein
VLGGPLSDDEQREFFRLLRRVCEHHLLDQWLLLRQRTKLGPHYIQITRTPAPGTDPEDYAWVLDSLVATQQASAPSEEDA